MLPGNERCDDGRREVRSLIVHAVTFIVGCALVFTALKSAVQTFVVPRGAAPDALTRGAFVLMRVLFEIPLRRAGHRRRERALAYYAPVTLLTLPILWLACVLLGYTAVYWALGATSWGRAITISRLSLLYLGSNINGIRGGTVVGFSETVLSLLLAAILVSYLPAIYSAFSQREQVVTGLETLAGSPSTPYKMLKRYYLINGMGQISEQWRAWQAWFELVEESHTALIPLVFYRSPQPNRSWVTAAGTILDTASLVVSTLDRPRDPQAELCIRAGYLSLQRVAAPLGIPFNENPSPTDPISVSREEYDAVYDALAELGVPLRADQNQAWRDFTGWRVNYDAVLVGLAVLTAAPRGVWSSDRISVRRSPFVTATRAARQAAMAAMTGRLPA
jgi:GAF domain-containing protein